MWVSEWPTLSSRAASNANRVASLMADRTTRGLSVTRDTNTLPAPTWAVTGESTLVACSTNTEDQVEAYNWF
jgi:hypothetical protein